MQTSRQKCIHKAKSGIQTYRQTYRDGGIHTNRQTYRHTGREEYKHKSIRTDKQYRPDKSARPDIPYIQRDGQSGRGGAPIQTGRLGNRRA